MEKNKEFSIEDTIQGSSIETIGDAIDSVVLMMNARDMSNISQGVASCIKSKTLSDTVFFIDNFIKDVSEEMDDFIDVFESEQDAKLSSITFKSFMKTARRKLLAKLASIDSIVGSSDEFDIIDTFSKEMDNYVDVIYENYKTNYDR